MNKSKIVDFDIEYEILDIVSNDKLYAYNIMPLYKEQLFVIVATSKQQEDIDSLVDVFNQPIKLVELKHKE